MQFPLQEKRYKMTPGPEYAPNLRPEIPKQPEYSLYARRAVKGFDPLIELNSTSEIVGPGSYHPEKSTLTSVNENRPHWSMPKGPRDPTHQNRWQLNQTYDTTSSVGLQPRSDKPSKPLFSVGKQKRDTNKSGIFQAHMEYRPVQVRIDHPKF
jgi:hypothetical protein